MAHTRSALAQPVGDNGGASPSPRLGAIVGVGLFELAVLLVLPLIAAFTRLWRLDLSAIILLAALLLAVGAWAVVLLLSARERILRAPAVFLAVGTLCGLAWTAVHLCRLTVGAGLVLTSWPLFDTPAAGAASPLVLWKATADFARTWLWVSAAVLAVELIAGFLYEMLRRERSTLVLSLGTVLLFGTSGWCAGGWLFLPLLLTAFPLRVTLLFVAVIFVFTLALLTGVRFAAVSPGSLCQPQGGRRGVSLVLAVCCVGLLGLMAPVLLAI